MKIYWRHNRLTPDNVRDVWDYCQDVPQIGEVVYLSEMGDIPAHYRVIQQEKNGPSFVLTVEDAEAPFDLEVMRRIQDKTVTAIEKLTDIVLHQQESIRDLWTRLDMAGIERYDA
jgi:hypothetical protein